MDARALTVEGTLHAGLTHDGKVHRDFSLRTLLVRDSVEAMKVAAGKGDLYLELALMARQLTLGKIPPESMNAELLLDLIDEDLDILSLARQELQKKIRSLKDVSANSGT